MRPPLFLAALAVALATSFTTGAAELTFLERFSLAEDREAVLRDLVPGTEDYFYFHALHYQTTGQQDQFEALRTEWKARLGGSDRFEELSNRQSLLDFEARPDRAYPELRRRLGLNFNQQRRIDGQQTHLPSRLDPASVNSSAFEKEAFASSDLSGFKPTGIERLVPRWKELKEDQRRDLLKRLVWPEVPGALDLVEWELKSQRTGGFGSLPIHGRLLETQLLELRTRIPELAANDTWSRAMLTRLAPPDGTDPERDPAVKLAWIQRLEAFADSLPPSQNSLKAAVHFRRIELDRSRGALDRNRFLTYLRLPRNTPIVSPLLRANREVAGPDADLRADFRPVLVFPPVGDDRELVRACLLEFLAADADYKPWLEVLTEDFVKPLFAEARLTRGDDTARASSLLRPQELQQLRDRIDLDLAPTNPAEFAPSDTVTLRADLKNVPNLLVRLYEINARNHYLAHDTEIGTDIELDGLLPTSEQTHAFSDAPILRKTRTFDFPQLKGRRGIWVIEFVGNGRSSRALIRKGGLQILDRPGAAGHTLTVLDEANRPVNAASVWVKGHRYTTDAEGAAVVPYISQGGRESAVAEDRDLAALGHFEHLTERIGFTAGFHIDREQLRPGATARIAVRPDLRISGSEAGLALIENPALTLITTDSEGISTTQEVRPFPLTQDREAIHAFRVPERVRTLAVRLSGRVRNVSQGRAEDVAADTTFAVNGIDATTLTDDFHLRRESDGYRIVALGRNGELRAGLAVTLVFRHRDYNANILRSVQTDAGGRVQLGALEGIAQLTLQCDGREPRQWTFEPAIRSPWPVLMNARLGDPVELPFQAPATSLSLIELRAGLPAADAVAQATVDKGLLTLAPAAPGDYLVRNRETGEQVALRIEPGDERLGLITGGSRILDQTPRKPLRIESIEARPDTVVVRLANVSPATRVLVTATHFVPGFDPLASLAPLPPMVRNDDRARLDSLYLSGRRLGDEYRYILERRDAGRFAGSMLPRPGLLLQPWEVRDTEAGRQLAQAGEAYGRMREGRGASAGGGAGARDKDASIGEAGSPGRFSNFDFLANPSAVRYNLVPDKDGTVTLPRADFGDRHHVRVIATDPFTICANELFLEPVAPKPGDLRLAHALDPKHPTVQRRTVTALTTGETLRIGDGRSAEFQITDSVPALFALLSTLSENATLAEFEFISRWDQLKPAERSEKYSKFACHELNLFLSRKDPAFFKAVVLPHLRNKKEKQFIDHYLLGDDLTAFAQPWAHGKLNLPEQILLGERLPDGGPLALRHVRDLSELHRPDPARLDFLFDQALRGRQLGVADQRQGVILGMESTAAMDVAATPAPSLAGAGGYVAAFSPASALAAPLGAPRSEEVDDRPIDAEKNGAALRSAKPAEREVSKSEAEPLSRRRADQLAKGKEARADQQPFFRQAGSTKEWAENQYFKIRVTDQNPALIPPGPFWVDYAARPKDAPFLSRHIALTGGSFTEMMFALALTDLPFQAAKHEIKEADGAVVIQAAGPAIVFHREMAAAEPAENQTPILVSENLFRADDRYRFEGDEQFDKFVEGTLQTGVVYGAQVVVTNPTSTPRRFEVLTQIPENAVALLGESPTRSRSLRLEPFSSAPFEYWFYFPGPGASPHFPVHVTAGGRLLGSGKPKTLTVSAAPPAPDLTSWAYVSQNSTPDEVIAFLDTHNPLRLDLGEIAWRMKDAAFFARTVANLSARRVFNAELWSYGLLHRDRGAFGTYLRHRDDFIARCGAWLDSPLIKIDPIERRAYEQLEYSPLFNARAHKLGEARRILNEAVRSQYTRLLTILACKPGLDAVDRMSAAYYLLLQDRPDAALAHFSKVDPAGHDLRLQQDYLRAWFAMVQDRPADALKVCAPHLNHPVARWRNLFARASAHASEALGRPAAFEDPDDRDATLERMSEREATLAFQPEGRGLRIDYRNLSEATVNLYRLDLEFLFSMNPFVGEDLSRFAVVKPTGTLTVKLPAGRNQLDWELPGEFKDDNLLVELTGAGKTVARARYANRLAVQVSSDYGRLLVTRSTDARPVSKAYVKIYARRAGGNVEFYKDGYTDARGRFDYASLTGPDATPADRFAILVLSEKDGALITETRTPGQ